MREKRRPRVRRQSATMGGLQYADAESKCAGEREREQRRCEVIIVRFPFIPTSSALRDTSHGVPSSAYRYVIVNRFSITGKLDRSSRLSITSLISLTSVFLYCTTRKPWSNADRILGCLVLLVSLICSSFRCDILTEACSKELGLEDDRWTQHLKPMKTTAIR